MNESIIMSMLAPYINNNSVTATNIDDIFGDFLTQKEIEEIVSFLPTKGITLINDISDDQKYFKLAQPYAKSGYMSYDDFDKAFMGYSRKKQYEIVEVLFSLGIELVDNEPQSIDIASSSIEELSDPLNITSEERNLDSFEILYDESIFKDKTKREVTVFSNITQKNEILCKLIQEGNEQARQDICVKNENLVRKYATAYLGYYGNDLSVDDLMQAGYLGLLKAAQNYDFSSDNAFSTYATIWIKQSITREIADCGYTIRVPVHMMEKIVKITKLDNYYDSKGMDAAERRVQIASDLQISEEDVRNIISIKKRFLRVSSLNDPVGEDHDTEMLELIVDTENEEVEDQIISISLSDQLDKALSSLSDKEREIIKYRFGLYDGKIWTLEEIASLYHLTRERIRQIECKALRKLKHPSSKLKTWL